MPELKLAEDFRIVVAFLVPGLIVTFIRSRLLTGRIPSHADAALSYVALSLVYYSIAFLVFDVFGFSLPELNKAIVWVVFVFFGPVLLGFVLGFEAKKGFLRMFLRYTGLNPVHVIPSAWDWKFGNMPPQWLRVTLKNGKSYAGFVSHSGSFMSTDPTERDIYIDQVYEIDDQEQWTPEPLKSVLIVAGEISTIEFWIDQLKENGHERETLDSTAAPT
jgi:hypothetical protein